MAARRVLRSNRNLVSFCHANFLSELGGFNGIPPRNFGSLMVSDSQSALVKNCRTEVVEDDVWRGWNLARGSSRSYGSVSATLRHAPAHPFRGRISQRNLFLKSSPEHAALQYLDAPDEEMLKQLHSILEGMRHSSSARVLIVVSTVPGVFCAGADLKERRKMGISETERFVGSLRSTFSALEALPIPTIAVVEGAALGGGLELALACDIRVCGDEAVFGLPETSLAIIPGAGGTQRLPRVIGRSRAKELIFTARRIDAERAETIGLVDHCVQAGQAYDKAMGIAREILAQGPLAVQVAKHAIDHGSEMDQAKGMLFEEACYSRLLNSRDRLEGLTAFAEKRKPVYHGE
ncbi:hypothetical protein AXG93_4620s1660 [Marchantia polymorpha subsp. ruderalis]|uniref:Enoyl-CoA hydratase n=1 Tax=Marchantia polymorpha subsp. ruderalis TaxID=1480154 RepID=A0A176VYB9_MARPO|nr:hypothetical protein AXG93_4620s1660 [Marchantia polymorpha subsp. ruderalis]